MSRGFVSFFTALHEASGNPWVTCFILLQTGKLHTTSVELGLSIFPQGDMRLGSSTSKGADYDSKSNSCCGLDVLAY